jgi:hypothetical protein
LKVIEGTDNVGVAARISKKVPSTADAFVEIWEIVPDAKSVVYAAMVLAVAEVAPTTIACTEGEFKVPTPPEELKAGASEEEKAARSELVSWLEDVIAARVPAMRMLLQLCLCYKVKVLKAKNLKGFFAARQNTVADPSRIHGLIVQVYAVIAGSFTKPGVEDLIAGDTFMQYHTLYSSSGGLVKKWLSEVGEMIGTIVPEGTKEAVDASVAKFWSSEANSDIPKMALVHTYAYLTASGSDFGSWYQGKKAFGDAPGFMQAKIEFFYTRLIEICAKTDGMKDQKTVDELVAAFRA